jgi:nicotinamidase-related amidase
MPFQVAGEPHPWPRGVIVPNRECAVLVVDMQADYCLPGYYMDRVGYDTRRLREPVGRIQRVLQAARKGGLLVVYTRHARAPRDRDGERLERLDTGAPGPLSGPAMRGEPGWQIVPELKPHVEDVVVDKTTIGGFASGELDRVLRRKGVRHLALCGNTIDVCVHSTLRAAVDLGYECLLLGDCCAAVNDGLHTWAIESVKAENGVFGTVADAEAFVQALPA